MVSEVIDLKLAEGEKEAVPLISHFSPTTVLPQSAEGIEIHFAAAVFVPQPSGRHPANDIIVVDEPVVRDLDEVDVTAVPDSWTSKSEETAWVGWNLSQLTPSSTNSCHRSAKRMTGKPKRPLILL